MSKSRTSNRSTSGHRRTAAILDFLNLGFKDYLAARVLLNNGLCLQGAILASTAVEKYFKALLSIRGECPDGHLRKAHLNSVRNFAPEMYRSLNESFLTFLQRCYKLRYLDQIPEHFNLGVGARMVLAELDITIDTIQASIRLRDQSGQEIRTPHRDAIERKNPHFFLNNHLVSGITKQEFLKAPDTWYGMRIRPLEGILEVEYSTYESRSDGNFLFEALKPVDSPAL